MDNPQKVNEAVKLKILLDKGAYYDTVKDSKVKALRAMLEGMTAGDREEYRKRVA